MQIFILQLYALEKILIFFYLPFICTHRKTHTVRSRIGKLYAKTVHWALCLVVLCSLLKQARKVHAPS